MSGGPIELLGYASETGITEKGVTTLERSITSTRWRDYIDFVQVAYNGFDAAELLRSARTVARYRGVVLEQVGPHLAGCGEIGQAKWLTWRRTEKLEALSEESLDDPGRTRRLLPRSGLPLQSRLTPHTGSGREARRTSASTDLGSSGRPGRCARMATHLAAPCRLDSFSEVGEDGRTARVIIVLNSARFQGLETEAR